MSLFFYKVLSKYIGEDKYDIAVLSKLTVFLILVGVYLALSLGLELRARHLVSQDHNSLNTPVSAKVIAVRRNEERRGERRRAIACDGFCLHALLSGEATRILVVESRTLDETPNPDESAIAFSLEVRDKCPEVSFSRDNFHKLELPRRGKYKVNAVDAMKIRMLNGECLVSRKARLADADMIITLLRKKKFGLGFSGFEIGNNFYDRIIVHLRDDEDGYKEVYRWTGVKYHLLSILPYPTVSSSEYFVNLAGMFSIPQNVINYDSYMSTLRDASRKFYLQTLKMDLAMDGDLYGEKVLDLAERVLKENRSPTKMEWDIISDYYKSIIVEYWHPVYKSFCARCRAGHAHA